MQVNIFTSQHCGYCAAAKRLLGHRGIDYKEVDLTFDQKKKASLMKKTGHRTVPQIFIDQQFIGGYQELTAYLKKH